MLQSDTQTDSRSPTAVFSYTLYKKQKEERKKRRYLTSTISQRCGGRGVVMIKNECEIEKWAAARLR